MEKSEPYPHLSLYMKINLKWIIDLTIRAKSIKLQEENKRKFSDLSLDKDFSGYKKHKAYRELRK